MRVFRNRTATIVMVASLCCVGLFGSTQSAEAWITGTNASPTKDTGATDWPDPTGEALIPGSASSAELFATGGSAVIPGSQTAIPEETWQDGTSAYGAASDAINPSSILPGQVLINSFAPTVRLINNTYVMWFTIGEAMNKPNCLTVATSASVTGRYSIQSQVCESTGTYGWFDPTIFQTGPNTYALIWSQELAGSRSNNSILAEPLTSNGQSLAGSVSDVANWQDMPGHGGDGPTYALPDEANSEPADVGGNAYIENPELVPEPRPYTDTYGNPVNYELLVSYGTFNQAGRYHTVEMPCATPYQCDEGDSWEIDPLLTGQLNPSEGAGVNPGGADFVDGTNPSYRYLFFHTGTNPRPASWETTGGGDPNLAPGQVLVNGNALFNGATGWALTMQNDGNLVLRNGSGTPEFQTATTGVSNAFAVMQQDGNFVVYNNGHSTFATNTGGHPGAKLVLQTTDNNLVVYSPSNTPLWSSGT